MVTNPIQKARSMPLASAMRVTPTISPPGEECRPCGGAGDDAVDRPLRTVPVTIHIPLREVPGRLSQAMIESQAKIVIKALADRIGITAPRIAVTGLNPHAGEHGEIGSEEVTIIAPAVAALRALGHDVTGPLPADTAFEASFRTGFDAFICMYHDQALIPIKTVGFLDGVNTTLGLPFIRTSPDHGTALPLAGTGRASPRSLIAALRLAAAMAARSR